jgi:hypothetical protein
MKHNVRMGLIDRIFGNAKEREGSSQTSTQFHESEPDSDDSQGSRNAPRRELVQVVLRDTMRKHGIPSDWIECRILSAQTRSGRRGLHVNFVVRKAHERLLTYVFAFQDSFEREIARYEPRAKDWLMSLGWEFQGFNAAEMPDPNTWVHSGPAPLSAQPPLVATRKRSRDDDDDAEPPKSDDDIERDLKALFAIRDAAMADTGKPPAAPRRDQVEFQPTQPFEDSGDKPK